MVVPKACGITAQSYITLFAYHGNISGDTLGLANEGYQFQLKLWESHDLTLQPVITYIYLCWRMHQAADISNIHYRIGQKLN